MITIIDLGLGNIGSVSNALKFLGYEHRLAQKVEQLDGASKLIFPGVGSYSAASRKLTESGFMQGLRAKVEDGVSLLGICLGMQLLTTLGTEGGDSEGLGLVDGKVVEIKLERSDLCIPHMGWNDVKGDKSPLFDGIQDGECFYFVHSYECQINEDISIGYTDYSRNIVASFSKGNVYGTQFHPEKSQGAGLKLLKNYIELC